MKWKIYILIASMAVYCQPTLGDDHIERWHHQLAQSGLPIFNNISEAVAFVTNEDTFLSYQGVVAGSEWFSITMPSGKTTNNHFVQSAFSSIFGGFQKECIPYLIDFLDNDALYLRVGAYSVLMQKAGRYDSLYDLKTDDREQRRVGVQAWRDWWLKNKDNPRLDQPPKRVYEAKEWDNQ